MRFARPTFGASFTHPLDYGRPESGHCEFSTSGSDAKKLAGVARVHSVITLQAPIALGNRVGIFVNGDVVLGGVCCCQLTITMCEQADVDDQMIGDQSGRGK